MALIRNNKKRGMMRLHKNLCSTRSSTFSKFLSMTITALNALMLQYARPIGLNRICKLVVDVQLFEHVQPKWFPVARSFSSVWRAAARTVHTFTFRKLDLYEFFFLSTKGLADFRYPFLLNEFSPEGHHSLDGFKMNLTKPSDLRGNWYTWGLFRNIRLGG